MGHPGFMFSSPFGVIHFLTRPAGFEEGTKMQFSSPFGVTHFLTSNMAEVKEMNATGSRPLAG